MRRRLICVAVVSATVLVVSGQSGKARAASFDCKNASNMVERLICTDPDLSQMDERLATAYSAARSQSADSKKLRSEQLAWISQRNHCLTAACVSESYNKRLAELGGRVADDRDERR